jgi:hypothetical protein
MKKVIIRKIGFKIWLADFCLFLKLLIINQIDKPPKIIPKNTVICGVEEAIDHNRTLAMMFFQFLGSLNA